MKKSSFVPLLIVSAILFVFAVMRFISAGTDTRSSHPAAPSALPTKESPISQTKDVAPPAKLAAARPRGEAEGILDAPDSDRADLLAFRRTTQELIEKLPTMEKVRNANKGKTHETPEEVLSAGDGQAQVIEAMRENPRLISDGVDFFKACAQKEDAMPAARAVCLRNFRVWAKRGNLSDNITVPDYIANIAKVLPAE